MFTIIGGDGKEYGPVTAAQVRAWIAAGRANLQTKAKAMGSDEWRTLADFPEFSGPVLPPVIEGAHVAVVSDATLADRGIRLVARLIDWVLELLVTLPGLVMLGPEFMHVVTAAMQGHEPNIEDMDMSRLAAGGLLLFAGWFILLVVQVWLLSVRGQSIGKIITGIRIVRVDETKAGFVNAWLLREALITVIGIMLGMMPFIGPILLRPAFHVTDWCFIFRDDKRCLHDLIASTKVVKVQPANTVTLA